MYIYVNIYIYIYIWMYTYTLRCWVQHNHSHVMDPHTHNCIVNLNPTSATYPYVYTDTYTPHILIHTHIHAHMHNMRMCPHTHMIIYIQTYVCRDIGTYKVVRQLQMKHLAHHYLSNDYLTSPVDRCVRCPEQLIAEAGSWYFLSLLSATRYVTSWALWHQCPWQTSVRSTPQKEIS